MPLILDGTNGISDVRSTTDGSAATPAIRGTDTNTGIFFPAADTIAFGEGGAESMRIDAAGNVGIGVTPSSYGTNFKAVQLGLAGNIKQQIKQLYITNTMVDTLGQQPHQAQQETLLHLLRQ